MLVYWRVTRIFPDRRRTSQLPISLWVGHRDRGRSRLRILIGWKFSPFFTRFFEEPKRVWQDKKYIM